LVLGLLALAGLAILIRRSPDEWFWPGFGVSVFGAVMQWWCFSCIMTSKELAVNGPYSFVRNPMYLSRFFLVLGGVVMIGNWWVTWLLLAALARTMFTPALLVSLAGLDQLRRALATGAADKVWVGVVLGNDTTAGLVVDTMDPAGPAADAGVQEQVGDVAQRALVLVEEIFARPVARDAAGDGHVRELELPRPRGLVQRHRQTEFRPAVARLEVADEVARALPVGHALGNAGSRSIVAVLLDPPRSLPLASSKVASPAARDCNNISPMPAQPPKLPSI
jgi:hypothetical protein